MPHHTAVGFANLADATLANIDAVADDYLRLSNSKFISSDRLELLALMLGGASMDYGYIDAPNLRCVTNPYIFPFNENATIPTDANFVDYSERPLVLPPRQEFGVKAYQDSAGASDSYFVMHLQRNFRPLPTGPIYTMRGTYSTAVTANAWSSLSSITWADQLPAGDYVVCGLDVISATCLACRIIPDKCPERPGNFGLAAVTSRSNNLFRMGGSGAWCDFENDLIPPVEVYCDSADSSFEVYMDIVQVSRR